MSSTYFQRLHTQTTLWEPPPQASNAGWFEDFDSASDLVKTNIANSWLWTLNSEYRSSDSSCRAGFGAQHIVNYAKAAPWICREHFQDAPYDGSVQALLLSNEPGVWNHVDPDTHDLFSDGFRRACMHPTADKISAFGDILTAIRGADKHSQRQLARFYPLVLTALWLEDAKRPDDGRDDWEQLLVKLSVACAVSNGMPPRNDLVNGLNSTGKSWMTLAYFACNSFTVDTTVGDELYQGVSSTKADIAVEAFADIFTNIMGAKGVDGLFFRGNTVLNSSNDATSDIYTIMRKWVPAHTDFWNTAEALELPVSEALSQAKSLTRVQAPLLLPTDLGNIKYGLDDSV